MAKKKVGVSIDEDLHAEVKSQAPKRRMLVEEAYEQALRVWLAGTSGTHPHTSITEDHLHVPPDLIPLVEWFIGFFQRKGTSDQEALKHSLRALATEYAASVKRDKKPAKNVS